MEPAQDEAVPTTMRVVPAEPPLQRGQAPTAAEVLKRALGTYRGRFILVVGMAIVVFVPLSVIDAAVDLWAEHYRRDHDGVSGMAVFLPVLLGTS
ncbi:MAG: hypothetical protein AB7U18_28395, partial [Dehalococcoidia bacterium]